MEKEPPQKKIIANELFFGQVQVYLEQGKTVSFRVKGASMLPFLKKEDKILIRPLADRKIKFGMIVLARSGTGYILHRVVRVQPTQIWLAGDGNLVMREVVERDNILGYADQVFREDKEIKIKGFLPYLKASIWYYSRPLRIIFSYMQRGTR